MGDGRAREFLFEPARFKNDCAVMRMGLEARGAYAILFCEAWDMAEPGVVVDEDRVLAVLARTDLETWLRVREEVRTAFDTVSRPGFWVQKGLVETRRSQKSWYDNQVELGRKGGLKARSKARLKGASRPAQAQGEVRLGEVGLGEVLKEEEEKKDLGLVLATISDKTHVQFNPASKLAFRESHRSKEPPDEFWRSARVKVGIETLTAGGYSLDEARRSVVAQARADGRLPK